MTMDLYNVTKKRKMTMDLVKELGEALKTLRDISYELRSSRGTLVDA